MPTPSGSLGRAWWWLVTGRSTLLSTSTLSVYGAESVEEDVEQAFTEVLTQYMDTQTKAAITVDAKALSTSLHAAAEARTIDLMEDADSFSISIWCATYTAFRDVSEAFLFLLEMLFSNSLVWAML